MPEVEESLAQTPYSVVHIASHGEFAGDPENSFLLTYNGRLDMDELEQLIKLSRFRDEPVELLTLSACRTAAGDDRAALGLAGDRDQGRRARGARDLVVHQRRGVRRCWSASSTASSPRRRGRARRRRCGRRSSLIKADPRYRHPAYWSPFLIIGNWL